MGEKESQVSTSLVPRPSVLEAEGLGGWGKRERGAWEKERERERGAGAREREGPGKEREGPGKRELFLAPA